MFPQTEYPDLLVGLESPDDAAVYRLDDERALISTMDFFPPVVDDPYAFGAIAAANALSDVYAMGGRPLMAINLVAYPDGLDLSILTEILRGGADKVREAGIAIAGGHTVTDREPKYGLSVTGEVHPEKLIAKGGAQVGDVLILSKPLGTGVITTALKRGEAEVKHVEAVVDGMSRLNKHASEVVCRYRDEYGCIHAMTDITGYSLLGHGHEMAHLSGVDLNINFDQLMWYDGTLQYAKLDIFPGGTARNQEYFKRWVRQNAGLADWQESLLYDPQTSGGLLIAVHPDYAEALLKDLLEGDERAAIIGSVAAGDGYLNLRSS